jgi:hypothetical protein
MGQHTMGFWTCVMPAAQRSLRVSWPHQAHE